MENTNQDSKNKSSGDFKTVSFAVKLFLGSIGIGLINLLVSWDTTIAQVNQSLSQANLPPAVGKIMVIGIQAFSIGIILLLILFVSKRMNWARILYLILFLVGTPMSLITVIKNMSVIPLSSIIMVVQLGLQAFALFILFTKPASEEFQKKSPQVASGEPSEDKPSI